MLSRDLLWVMPLRRASLGLLSNLSRGAAFVMSMESRTFYRRRCALSIRRLLLALIWNRCPLSFHTPLRIDEAGSSPNCVHAGDMSRSRICLFFSDNSLLGDAHSQFQSHSHAYFVFRDPATRIST